ncbi:uncharacterized protein LOC129757766 [Uranotaenia lowii]|uniref:uncharacterized protein LOC129757766 n=1 Tax=Uranotaenia lowii TaxID=190385 RepID=UPI002479E870|nr:uncharacterized protein LOC129757766 [Uranotaenia lowii]
MNRFVVWILGAFLLTANAATLTGSVTGSCHKEDSKKCVIQSITVTSDSQQVLLPDLKGKHTLQIKGGNIGSFSQQICDQMPDSVKKLQLGSLDIQEFYLKPNLEEVEAERNGIVIVNFDSAKSYATEILKLSGNKLNNLNGFEKLTQLQELHLSSNKLDTVNMATFAAMTRLERLYLDQNEITSIITTEPISLPNLDFLSIADNKISRLDVVHWKFDSLTSLDISGNDLVRIEGLTEHLVTLQSITFARNAWHCMWLKDILSHFNASYVHITDSDEGCEGISPANICCLVDPELGGTYDENFQQLEKLEKEQTSMQKRFEDKFRSIVSEFQPKLNSLESQLKDLIGKQATGTPVSDQDNLFQNDFGKLKNGLHGAKNDLTEQIKLFKDQVETNRRTERQLRFTILELKRSLERETKKIAELQAQFGLVKDHVVSKSGKRGSA